MQAGKSETIEAEAVSFFGRIGWMVENPEGSAELRYQQPFRYSKTV